MRALAWIGLFALAACGTPAPSDAGTDTGAAPEIDAGPPIDPALFDCRASAPPARVSPAPLLCATDPSCTERLASSHRGAGAPSVIAPENTLSAIRAAIALGADLVELDVRPTSDEVLVLMHDGDVDRTTSGSGPVSGMTLAEVQALEIDASGFAGDFSCERVPTFEEVLALADGRVVLVVDASKTDRVDLIVSAIQAADAVDRVVFDTADSARIESALALEPALRFLVRAGDETTLSDQLAAVAPATPVYVHVDTATSFAPAVHDAGLRAFALGFGADILAADRRGPAAYGDVYEAGVDMIQSNRIDLLAEFLGRR